MRGICTYFTKLRPAYVEGAVFIRADCRKKEGGIFVPMLTGGSHHWTRLRERMSKIIEPEGTWIRGQENKCEHTGGETCKNV